jgi:hypothetical protein
MALRERYDVESKIRAWQVQAEQWDAETQNSSLVTRLCTDVVGIAKETLHSLPETIPKKLRKNLERSCSSIVLWADGYGIQEGRLDETLAKSRASRESTLKILSSISRIFLNSML